MSMDSAISLLISKTLTILTSSPVFSIIIETITFEIRYSKLNSLFHGYINPGFTILHAIDAPEMVQPRVYSFHAVHAIDALNPGFIVFMPCPLQKWSYQPSRVYSFHAMHAIDAPEQKGRKPQKKQNLMKKMGTNVPFLKFHAKVCFLQLAIIYKKMYM